jgi:hypothetical protein
MERMSLGVLSMKIIEIHMRETLVSYILKDIQDMPVVRPILYFKLVAYVLAKRYIMDASHVARRIRLQ